MNQKEEKNKKEAVGLVYSLLWPLLTDIIDTSNLSFFEAVLHFEDWRAKELAVAVTKLKRIYLA